MFQTELRNLALIYKQPHVQREWGEVRGVFLRQLFVYVLVQANNCIAAIIVYNVPYI